MGLPNRLTLDNLLYWFISLIILYIYCKKVLERIGKIVVLI